MSDEYLFAGIYEDLYESDRRAGADRVCQIRHERGRQPGLQGVLRDDPAEGGGPDRLSSPRQGRQWQCRGPHNKIHVQIIFGQTLLFIVTRLHVYYGITHSIIFIRFRFYCDMQIFTIFKLGNIETCSAIKFTRLEFHVTLRFELLLPSNLYNKHIIFQF